MGLSDAIARSASRHAHALVVEVPGSWRTRMAAERNVAARGWRLAISPADADVLVVCGEPGPGLAEAIEGIWHQMPGPRVRVYAHAGDEVGARLDEAHTGLLDTDLQELELRLNAYRPAINEASCILQAMAPAHRQLMLGVTCNATKLFDLSRSNASQPELDAVLDTLDAAWNAYRAAVDAAK